MDTKNCEYSNFKTIQLFIETEKGLEERVVSESGDYYLIEGDIIIARKEDVRIDDEKGIIIPVVKGRRWPDAVLHYDWEPALENDQRILDAIAHWEKKTKIRFHKKENDQRRNYVYFQTSDGCSSYIGMIGGKQPINLSPLCSRGAVIHEIGHALGLYHEHTRPDRDEYIRVNFENIEKGQKHNFLINKYSQVFGAYDFESIMHYSEYAFSYNNLPTIEVLEDDPKPTIGNRTELSQGDINTIQGNYQKRVLPCGYEPCDPPYPVTAGIILQDAMLTPYESDIYIQSDFVLNKPITKTRNLIIGGSDPIIELDLSSTGDSLDNYFAVVVENMIFENVNPQDFDLKIRWHWPTIPDLIDSLKGDPGVDAPAVIGAGAHGLPGGTGGKGKTKHGATLFFFVKNLIVNNGQKSDITMRFDLKGISGGEGGQGGKGSNGNKGARGRNARNGDFGSCRRGGSHGKQGGNPGAGGRGGNGGCGGNGGSVKFYFNDPEFWEIFGSSEFELSGHQMDVHPENRHGNGGKPGVAGRQGDPGDRGSHAGNCSRHSNRGARSGSPIEGSFEWQNWNLGYGLPSPSGDSGDWLFETLDNYTNVVFLDPLAEETV